MLVTLLVLNPFIDWLNAVADENMSSMDVTFPVSHRLRGWLNAVAPKNIPAVFVTSLVSHSLTCLQLKLSWKEKK